MRSLPDELRNGRNRRIVRRGLRRGGHRRNAAWRDGIRGLRLRMSMAQRAARASDVRLNSFRVARDPGGYRNRGKCQQEPELLQPPAALRPR